MLPLVPVPEVFMRKKVRLYIADIMEEPHLPYPAYYLLTPAMIENELLHSALTALHMLDFRYYTTPNTHEDIFKTFDAGAFAVYKERYVVGCFGGRLMYLESTGWRTMPVTQEVYELEQWLLP